MGKTSVSIILEHGRCSWGKCYFCGWGRREAHSSLDQLKERYQRVLEKNRGKASVVKVFSSGSLLDPRQFPVDFVRWLIEEAARQGYREIVVESRPEYVTREALGKLRVDGIRVTVAMGLEAADDKILQLVDKGFTVEDYRRAARLLRSMGFGVRTYILVNMHPVLYMDKRLQETVLERSLRVAAEHSDSIVVINAYPHHLSSLLDDWIEGRWKPLSEKEFYELVERVLARVGAARLSHDEYMLPNGVRIELDHQNFAFKPRIPRRKQVFLKGVGRHVLEHPHFQVWQDYIVRFYKPPRDKEYALLLPCSYRKPYKKSKTHRAILSAISGYPWFRRLHLIVVSTPGVVPYELHDNYPFTSYDWPEWMETPEVKKDYIEVTRERVKNYLRAHGSHYKLFFAYFHLESETLEAIRQAFSELGMDEKLVVVLDKAVYGEIRKEYGDKPVGSSILRHPRALEQLRKVLRKHLEH